MLEGIIMIELSCTSTNGSALGLFDLAGVEGGIFDDGDWVD